VPNYEEDSEENRRIDAMLERGRQRDAAEQAEWNDNIRALKAGDSGATGVGQPGGQSSDGDTSGRTASKDELGQQEQEAGESGGASESEGQGDRGSSKKSERGKPKRRGFAQRMLGSNSKMAKRAGIAAMLAGGSVGMGMLAFLLLLPLKIEHIIQNLERTYSAAAKDAVGKETEHLFNGYIRNSILPALNSGTCQSTIDPGCTVNSSGDGPVGQLYAAWSKNRLENKLAKRYGLIFSKSGPNFFMNVNGHNVDLNTFRAGTTASVFDLPGTQQVSRSEMREILKTSLRGGTLWDRSYGRFVYGRYLERQFSVRRCIVACDVRDKFTDKIADKKLAAKAYLAQRLVPEKYGVIMQCVILGGCNTDLEQSNPGDESRQSQAQRNIKDVLREARTHFADNELAKLVENANDIAKDGFTKVFARAAAKKMVSAIAGDAAGQAAGKLAEKAVPVIGWVFLIAQVISLANHAGPIIQYMSYAANAATAVALYSSYNTVNSEMKSGHIDPTMLGSFASVLGSNLTGADADRVDATATPLYQYVVNGDAPPEKTSTTSPYKCKSGLGVPGGQLTCPEEKLGLGNSFFNAVHDFIDGIPVIPQLADLITWIGDKISNVVGVVWEGICSAIPGCQSAMDQIAEWVAPIFAWLGDKILSSPFTDNMSGGTTFDMMTAGADVSHNGACHTTLGCAQITDAQAAAIRNEVRSADKAEFAQQNFFARMFDTSSSFSLVSQIALKMPTDLQAATTTGVASFLSNPFGKLGRMFGAAVIPSKAHALVAMPDPFGVIQYGYTPDQIPTDPQKYWDDNKCGEPDQVSNWLNNDNYQDTNTGEATTKKVNPCLLIASSAASMGIMYDPSMAPKGADGGAAAPAAPTGGTNIPTGDVMSLAQQIKSSPNISFQTSGGAAAFDTIAATGRGTQCGAPAVSATLLGVILKLSESYKLVLGVFVDDHGCDGGFHPKGSAVDLNGVNPLNGGGGGTGTHITFASGEQTILKQFYQSAGEILAANGGGGLGQQQCFSGPAPKVSVPPNVYFDDSCNHIHMDTRGR
jgi:hypothetical protein